MSISIKQSLIFWPILKNFPKDQLSRIRCFMVINEDDNPLDAVVITDDDKVFGFYRDASKVTKIVELGGGKKIVQMCHGDKHVLALTNEGQVQLWNEVLSEQLKANKNTIESLLPAVIDFGKDAEPIAMVKCGLGHNLAVTEKTGKVYAWGKNDYGQCGVGTQTNQLIPTKVSQLEELVVVKVECGDDHSMALTDNGLVYSWGYNSWGQLGTENNYSRSLPVKVTINTEDNYFKDIACGSHHSLLLTEQGMVYCCGRNNVNQLGIGSNQYANRTLVKIDINGVLFGSIYAVGNLSVAISESEFCYAWGELKNNQKSNPCNTNLISIDNVLGVHSPDTRISRMIQITSPMSPLGFTLCESFNDPTSSDLKFVLDGRSIHVHRLLLQISSPYYQRMLSDDWLKSDSVKIDGYSYSVYYARLRYLYTGHFPQMDNLDETIELFDLANCQLDYGFRNLCIEHLTEMVSIDNCCRLFYFAIQYKLDSMRQTIRKFIAANLNKVITSDSFESLTVDQSREIILSLKHFIKR